MARALPSGGRSRAPGPLESTAPLGTAAPTAPAPADRPPAPAAVEQSAHCPALWASGLDRGDGAPPRAIEPLAAPRAATSRHPVRGGATGRAGAPRCEEARPDRPDWAPRARGPRATLAWHWLGVRPRRR